MRGSGRAMSVKFVVNAEDGGCEDEELSHDRAVSCCDLVSVRDDERDEGEDDSGDE